LPPSGELKQTSPKNDPMLKWEKPSFKRVDDPKRIIPVLAELDSIEYEQLREKMAKKLGFRTSILDQEIAKLRPKSDDPKSGALVDEVEPWSEPVTGNEVLIEIHGLLKRHVILPDGAVVPISIWVVGTYCFDAFRIWPKLCISSPEKRCGKTTLKETIAALCNRSLVASNITPAAVFRVIEACQPTLLIDEGDTFLPNNEELRGIINSGHTKQSAFVIRTVGDNHEPAKFSTWSPMVLAMIKHPPDTIMDRSIVIELRRKLPSETTEKLPLTFSDDCEVIRRKLKRWADDHMGDLKTVSPELPHCNNDRALDNWTPLFAIAGIIGGDWLEQVKKSFELLVTSDDDDEGIGPMILSDIREILRGRRWEKIFSIDLVEALTAMEERPWSEWKRGKPLTQNSLSRLLKPFGIKSGTVRLGVETQKGYKLKQFKDAFNRYLAPYSPNQTVTPTQSSKHTVYSRNQSDTKNTAVSLLKSLQPTDDRSCDSVTDENRGAGKELIENPINEVIF